MNSKVNLKIASIRESRRVNSSNTCRDMSDDSINRAHDKKQSLFFIVPKIGEKTGG